MKNSRKKRSISVLLAIVMALSLCTPAMAGRVPGPGPAAEITVGSTTVSAGASFVVPITIVKNPGITNFGFLVTYNKEAMTLTKMSAYASVADEENMNNPGLCGTGMLVPNVETGIVPWGYANSALKANKDLFYLYFTVKPEAAAGNYEVSIGLNPITGVFQNGMDSNNVIDHPVNFTPGIITVNAAPVVPCDVKFIDDANVQTLKPNTNSIMTTLPAEPTKADHIFAGWYSGVDQETITANYVVAGTRNSFTGKEFRPKYDMVTGAAEYHAVWIPVANTAAFIRDNTSNVATIHANETSLQSALTGAVGKTIKLLKDWTVQITVPAGANLTLDMNGHSIKPNFTAYDGAVGAMSGIKNSGTLSLENSSSAVALIAPTGSNILGRYVDGVFVAKTGVITSMRDITITATNYDITGEKNGKIDLIDHCALTTTAYAEACIFNVIVGELRGSTLTNTTKATITTGGMSVTLGEGNTFKPKAGSPAITVDKSNTVVFPTGKTMGPADVNGNYTLTPGFTVYYLNEGKTAVREVSYCPTGTKVTVANPIKPSNGMTSYTFAGWADSTGTLKTLAEIKENTELHPTFTSVTAFGDVAQVGSEKYTSIQAAADAIVAGSKTGTITVLKDFEFACTYTTNMLSVPAGATITLDLGAKTITMKDSDPRGVERPIINKGTLILQNGTITAAAGFPTADVVLNDENGVLTLDRLTITNFFYAIFNRGATIANITDTNIAGGQHAIYSAKASDAGVITDPQNDPKAGKILKITSGTFSVTASSGCAALSCMDTYIGEIAGGTFRGLGATQTWGARLKQSKVDKISGGTFETISPDYDGMHLDVGTTVGSITGGTFTGTQCGVYHLGTGTVNITGGTFAGTTCGGVALQNASAKCNISGTAKVDQVNAWGGTITVSGGMFKALDPIYLAPGKVLGDRSDKDGYYPVETYKKTEPTVTGGVAVVTVPDVALDAERTHLDAKTPKQKTTKTEVTLGAAVVGSMDKAGSLEISTDTASVQFNDLALKAVKAAAGAEPVKLTVDKQEWAELNPAQKKAAEFAGAIIDLKLTKGTSGTGISDFGTGAATVVVPYSSSTQGVDGITYKVYHLAEDGKTTEIPSTYTFGSLSFDTNHFSQFIVVEDLGPQVDYTMTVKTAADHFNPGDSITATIVATAPVATSFGNCQFTLDYDKEKLELTGLTSTLTPAPTINMSTGTLVCVTDAAEIAVGTTDTVLGTATFKVKAGVPTGAANLTLNEAVMTLKGINKNPPPKVVAKSVNLHNIKLTFAAGTGSTLTPATAYAKYNTAGLYANADFTGTFTIPTPSASAGYRLATKPWGDGTTTYSDAEVTALVLTESKALTVQTVQQYTVTFASDAVGGSIATTPASAIVDTGALASTLTMPVVTAKDGYSFTGWHDGTNIIAPATYAITKDITLTAKFAPISYTWNTPSTANTRFAITSGVTDGKVTHGTDVVFTATPSPSYVITGVSYQVGTAVAQSLSEVSGSYTIPGSAILGDITLSITTLQYHTVTFKGGTGATLAETVLYVKHNTAGLYSDIKCTVVATVPVPAAAGGYRLAKDDVAEPLWKDGTLAGATSTAIAGKLLTADAVYTAQAVQQWTVTFAAGANGSLSTSETALMSQKFDVNHQLVAADIPTPVGNAGYVFDAWSAVPLNAAVTADITYTASFKDGIYNINFSGGSAANFTEKTGVTATTQETVTHGTDVTFKVAPIGNYKVTAVNYQIGAAAAKTLTPAVGTGVYTIPGIEITDAVSVTVASTETFVVTFAASANGTLTGGDKSSTLDKDYALKETDIPVPVAATGYKFKEWQVGGVAATPLGHVVTAALTFTAVFEHGTYAVTMPAAADAVVTPISGFTGNTVTHGTDAVFDIVGGAGKIVNKVFYQVGAGAKTEIRLTGKVAGFDTIYHYVIPGSALTGPVTITVETIGGTLTMLKKADYKISIGNAAKMFIFETTKLTGSKYVLTNGKELYWSGKYNAYVCILGDAFDETLQTVSANLTVASGNAIEIDYSGDLNETGNVRSDDAGIINDTLHSKRKVADTDMQRFQMDHNGDKTVTTADVAEVIILAGQVGK